MKSFKIFLRYLSSSPLLAFFTLMFIMVISSFSLILPVFFKVLLDYVLVNKIENLLNYFVIIILIFVFLKFVFTALQDFMYITLRQKTEEHTVKCYIKEILKLKSDQLNHVDSGDMINRLTTILNNFPFQTITVVYFVFYALFISISTFIIMYVLSKTLLLYVLLFVVLHCINFYFFSPRLKRNSDFYYTQKAKVSSSLVQFLDGYVQISTSWLKKNFIYSFHNRVMDQYFSLFKRDILSASQKCIQVLLIGFSKIAIFLVGGLQVISGEITIGTLMLFLLIMYFLYEPINMLSDVTRNFNEVIAQLQRIYEYTDKTEKENFQKRETEIQSVINEISIDDVTFSYNGSVNIFSSINYKFEKGKIYLLSGPSGTGKTTLFNLLIRLYEPSEGNILFDGINIKNFALNDLRKKISICIQDDYLYTGSIIDNVSCFASDRNENMVKEACEISTADLFISRLSHRYNMILSEGGASISGGEKQRLNIARAVYDDKEIMLMDEPTSNLDEVSEENFLKNLNKLKNDKIIIIISHKQKVKNFCDEIVYLNKLSNKQKKEEIVKC